jgi:general nucleoside transport system ATP-binding protein
VTRSGPPAGAAPGHGPDAGGGASVTGGGSGVPMLSLERISHRFGSVPALQDASLTVRAGTVHALLGENGAGKTTLMRIVFGLLAPDSGTLLWNGAPLRIASPADALNTGIGMVHQHFTLVPAMTVAENVALGGHGGFDPVAAAARVRDVAAHAGLALDPHARVDALPVGAQQRCEIVKALARHVQLLILDEPTAVLAPAESAELLAWVRRHADAGNAVVLITHKLRDALAVADEVTVLHKGRTVLAAAASATSEAQLAAAMIGGEAAELRKVGERKLEPRETTHEVVLALQDVTWRDDRGVVRVRDASLEVHAGEIVGIAAVEGAGQHELLRLLTGRLEPHTGRVQRPSRVGFVPEDRHRDALLLDAPLFENTALRGAGARRGRMAWRTLRENTASLLTRFDVRASGPTAVARTLSGGNQQKFVLGRELAEQPQALVVENPSRGLDFKATAAVQHALREARDAGTAVVVYSSDLDEVLMLADRVLVMHAGALHEVVGDREAVGRAMLGGAGTDGSSNSGSSNSGSSNGGSSNSGNHTSGGQT